MMKAGKEGTLHLLMEKWARQHGEIFRVRSGIVTEYFINSDKAVKVSSVEPVDGAHITEAETKPQ